MLSVSDAAAGVMAGGGYVMLCRVDSWRGSELLAGDIPISGGTLTVDATLNVPEGLSLTVPRHDDEFGTVWAPGLDVDSPLACWGQRLHVAVSVQTGFGFEPLPLGVYYITDADSDDTTVTVQASGLLGLIQEAEFISPFQPSGTFTTVIRQMVEPALTVDFDGAPTDRTVPANTVASSDRLTALQELLDAWPAIAYVRPDGILAVTAAGDTGTSSLSLTDGAGGTAMRWGNRLSRSGAASAVVARGTTATGVDVQAVAYDTSTTSPTAIGGPFNGLPVPFASYSPLLTTVGQCQKAADTILARRKREAAVRLHVECVPNFALQPRDGVTVTSTDLGIDGVFGIVDQITYPLTPSDGAMQLGVRLPR